MLYATIIFLAILLALLFSKIKFFCEYKKYPGEKLYTDFRISVGFVPLGSLAKKKIKKNAPKSKIKNEEKLIHTLKRYARTLKIVKEVYAKNRWHIRKTLKVEKLNFHIKFGLSDAAITGIATGAIWSVLYSLTALISQVGTLNKHYFEVVPVYTEKGFISEGRVKLNIRVINAISLCARLYLTYKKVTKTSK